MAFDDVAQDAGRLIAPTRDHINALIGFARDWNGSGTLLVHCRAGSSRSPAAAMIAAAAIGRVDLAGAVAAVRSYFKPHRGCLRLADSLFGGSASLVDLVRPPAAGCNDPWEPVVISP